MRPFRCTAARTLVARRGRADAARPAAPVCAGQRQQQLQGRSRQRRTPAGTACSLMPVASESSASVVAPLTEGSQPRPDRVEHRIVVHLIATSARGSDTRAHRSRLDAEQRGQLAALGVAVAEGEVERIAGHQRPDRSGSPAAATWPSTRSSSRHDFQARAELLEPLGLEPAEVMIGEHRAGTRIEAEPHRRDGRPGGVWVAATSPTPRLRSSRPRRQVAVAINFDLVLEDARLRRSRPGVTARRRPGVTSIRSWKKHDGCADQGSIVGSGWLGDVGTSRLPTDAEVLRRLALVGAVRVALGAAVARAAGSSQLQRWSRTAGPAGS